MPVLVKKHTDMDDAVSPSFGPAKGSIIRTTMPTLDWIGRKAVVNHHHQVPFHLLHESPKLSYGDTSSGNLIIEGDNLLALKALLPYYGGQVKCIYIDPPYNTGKEQWVYNDNVNSPEIRRWLGQVVGAESEDLSRHDKWLCMMYPRLSLLHQFLRKDGAILISIDDNEIHNLRHIMNEIFGENNFIACIEWQKIYTIKNSAKFLSTMHDHILFYAKDKNSFRRNLRPRDEDTDEDYDNPDDDPRGPWISNALQSRNYYSKGVYSVDCPGGRVIEGPPAGTYWRLSKSNFLKLDKQKRVWWGLDGNNAPRIKKYLSEVKGGVVPTTWWPYQYAGSNSSAKTLVRAMLGGEEPFITPKPPELINRILELVCDDDSIVLDSFAGSGSTGHAVLLANAMNPSVSNKRFILIEMEHNVANKLTTKRLVSAIDGFKLGKKNIKGLGSGFHYITLGESLFDENGRIRNTVKFPDLARHVFFAETGVPLPKLKASPLLGIHNGTAVYLLYNGILKDKSPDGGNVLTTSILAQLPAYNGAKVIYGTACKLSSERLRRENIIFKQLPYKLKVGAP